jgi:putative MATE family efflux protein
MFGLSRVLPHGQDGPCRGGVDRLGWFSNTGTFCFHAGELMTSSDSVLPTELHGTLRPMLRLALPVLAEQFLATLVMYSDTILAGQYLTHLGPAPLAAMTLLAYFVWLLTSLFAFVAIGSLAMTARFVGAGDRPMALRTANQSLVAGLLLSLLVVAGFIPLLGPVLSLLNADDGVAALTSRYLYFLLPVLPAVMLTQVGPACLRGAGDSVPGMLAMGVVNVVNVAIGWGLVCPALAGVRQALGLPELGWDGLAIGAAVGYAVGGLLMLWFLIRGRAGLQIVTSLLRPDWQFIRRILRIGVPGGCDAVMAVGCQLWFVSIIFHLGSTAAAAHGVGVRIESLAYLPGSAFQAAAATLAGQYLGARDPRRATRAVLITCLVGGSVMTAAGVVFFFGGEPLVRIFVSGEQTEVITLAASLLKIVAFAMPPFALMSILLGALRGAGDTRLTMAITTVGFLVVRIPLAYALTRLWPLGVYGAWYAMVADLCVRSALVGLRFRHGGWKHIAV